MEDAPNKDTCINSSIIYKPLGIDRNRHKFKQLWSTKALIASVAVLVIFIPVWTLLRQHYVEVIKLNIPKERSPKLMENARLICYYTFPSQQNESLLPEQIDPYLCTHINVGFATIKNNSLYLTTEQLNIFNATTALKIQKPSLKVLISIGGAGNNSGFSEMVVDHQHRKNFIKSVDDFVRAYKCDGIDLDWEFPSSENKQRMHFTQLLYEIRKEIKRQHRHKFIVSVAVAAPKFLVDLSYDVSYMNDYVDFVNVMTYDFHFYTSYNPITGLNAPLYPAKNDFFDTFNINYSINHWVESGMDRQKINVGLPTYGHTFQLFNENNNGLGAPARGIGKLGSAGFADYSLICRFLLLNTDAKVVFDYSSRSPYATKDLEWLSFDDETSLVYKAQYVNNGKFGGAMIFSLNADDHSGACRTNNRFPLTNCVKSVLSMT